MLTVRDDFDTDHHFDANRLSHLSDLIRRTPRASIRPSHPIVPSHASRSSYPTERPLLSNAPAPLISCP